MVVIGNVGGAMWPLFRAAEPAADDPLDTWTRAMLGPIAASRGASMVRPSQEAIKAMPSWGHRAAGKKPEAVGLGIPPEDGVWAPHRRGVSLFWYGPRV